MAELPKEFFGIFGFFYWRLIGVLVDDLRIFETTAGNNF